MALARTSKCSLLRGGSGASDCGPWTVHSVRLHAAGPQREEAIEAVRSFMPAPVMSTRTVTDRETGEIRDLVSFIALHFGAEGTEALMGLAEIARLLEGFPWGRLRRLAVNRVDLACDHLVADDPRDVCDRIAALRLPYSSPYRGRDGSEAWLSIYHNGGKAGNPRVRVVHYPRLEALLRWHRDASSSAIRYAAQRVRQEVRFRGPAMRQRLGGGSMTPGTVFGSFPTLVAAAERRLRPVFEAGILSVPGRDLEGEAALLALAEVLQ